MIQKPRVLVGVALHKDAIKQLKEVADVDTVSESLLANKKSLLKIVGNYEGVIIATPPFDREVMEKAKKLRIISRRGVGYDNVDVEYATERGLFVTITPVLSGTVADMTFALILAAARLLPQAHVYVKSGLWKDKSDRDRFRGVDVFGKTLGIIGLGRIGLEVAKRGKGFDMKILYHDIVRKSRLEEELNVRYLPLNRLLAEADFISINVPLTEKTRALIGEKEFKIMKQNAVIINTSRGPVIDEKSLFTALKEKWIAAAGLDVFENEPINPDNPLLTLNNLILAPHIAGTTKENQRRCSMVAVENTIRALRGEIPLYTVRAKE